MDITNNRNAVVAALFILIGLATLVRGSYAAAIGSVSIAISLLLFAPPKSRAKSIIAYFCVVIACLSIIVWAIELANFPIRVP